MALSRIDLPSSRSAPTTPAGSPTQMHLFRASLTAMGLDYIQLSDVAELVQQAQGAPSDELLEELDARYSALIPRDQVIADQFEALLQQCPDDFAPAS